MSNVQLHKCHWEYLVWLCDEQVKILGYDPTVNDAMRQYALSQLERY